MGWEEVMNGKQVTIWKEAYFEMLVGQSPRDTKEIHEKYSG
jgi:hypothetical protein